MALRILVYLILSFSSICSHRLSRRSIGLQECRSKGSPRALDVLPGLGWDNLRNLNMGQVMKFNYSQCQMTEDEIFLIPDEVFVIPQKFSYVETLSDISLSWLDTSSITSLSINAEPSFFPFLNGKFSLENERMRIHQVKEKAAMTRQQVRNHLYTVRVHPDFALDSRFTRQAEGIAEAIENNQTRQAAYLSEKLVRDYGTHVITSVEAGACLVQEEYIHLPNVSSNNSSKLSGEAGLDIFNINISLGGGGERKLSDRHDYEKKVTFSVIKNHGGTPFYPGITVQQWQESTLNNLAAIDRRGVSIDYVLSKVAFPNLPEPTVHKLALSVHEAVQRYYIFNKHPGCVKQESPYFNFQANVDDNSCEGVATNLSFGGVYQICTQLTDDAQSICNSQAQKNIETGDYSCGTSYNTTLLHSQNVEEAYRYCPDKCPIYNVFCTDECTNRVKRAKIETYWCSTDQKTQQHSGFLFGGLYGPSLVNPLTRSRSCPPHYNAIKFLASGLKVCLSTNHEAGTRFSVPFGGFFSCSAGNPIMGGQRGCPPKFSQHQVAISDGCEVLYCVQSRVFIRRKLLPIRLPPFMDPPIITMVATNNVTNMTAVTEGKEAEVLIGSTKMSKLAMADEVKKVTEQLNHSKTSGGEKVGTTKPTDPAENQTIQRRENPADLDKDKKVADQLNDSQMSGWEKFAITIGVIVTLVVLVMIGVHIHNNVQRRHSEQQTSAAGRDNEAYDWQGARDQRVSGSGWAMGRM